VAKARGRTTLTPASAKASIPAMSSTTLSHSHWPADTSEQILDTTVGGVLRDAAAEAADAPALIEGAADPARARRWTYSELREQSERMAQALLERFDPGEHVAVWAANQPEWLMLEFGAALAGLVLVTVNPAYRPAELAYVLGQSGAAGIVLASQHRGQDMLAALASVRAQLPRLREVIPLSAWDSFLATGNKRSPLPDVHPYDAAQIQYTSGTTGFPKGALLHHRGLTNNARLTVRRVQMQPGEVYLNPMPLFHTAGSGTVTLGSVQALGTQVLVPAFQPGLVLELAERERANLLLAVPTMLIAMLEHPALDGRDLTSFRVVISGGALVPPDVVQAIERRLGARFSIVFGQTETSPIITMTGLEESFKDRSTTLGRPLSQTEVKIADPTSGETLPCGEVGELCASGYLVMTGYYDMPEATAAAIDTDGWLHTGDLGSIDERGYCRIEGRLKDMIVRGGENIYPREIENALFEHPAVGEVAVLGIPDRHWGEQVAAFIRPAAAGPPPDFRELDAYLRGRLAPYKRPRIWKLVDEFPLTASGKIQKHILREQYNAEATE
jgi:fatty-acyl-CoA synthase